MKPTLIAIAGCCLLCLAQTAGADDLKYESLKVDQTGQIAEPCYLDRVIDENNMIVWLTYKVEKQPASMREKKKKGTATYEMVHLNLWIKGVPTGPYVVPDYIGPGGKGMGMFRIQQVDFKKQTFKVTGTKEYTPPQQGKPKAGAKPKTLRMFVVEVQDERDGRGRDN